MKSFEGRNPRYSVAADMEDGRVFDITDPKWGHPEVQEGWGNCSGVEMLHNPLTPQEQKPKIAEQITSGILSMFGNYESEHCDIQKYTISGCPEEPETQVEVRVYRPKNLKKKKARCLFYCLGGALVLREPEMFPIEQISMRHNCVVVVCMYRRSWEAQYPAAINDLHAAYKWMMENSEMLKINPDNIVLNGVSSGAHLATALAFRLKRYGYSPKGVVAIVPQTDERENNALSHKMYNAGWDAGSQRQALAQWLGVNFGNTQIGPEALANHATIEDCIGYPPLFIHTVEFDPDRDNCREFYGKVLEAKTYAEFHCWAGALHGGPVFFGDVALPGDENLYSKRVNAIIAGNIEDCFTYDFRRPWVLEEFNK